MNFIIQNQRKIFFIAITILVIIGILFLANYYIKKSVNFVFNYLIEQSEFQRAIIGQTNINTYNIGVITSVINQNGRK